MLYRCSRRRLFELRSKAIGWRHKTRKGVFESNNIQILWYYGNGISRVKVDLTWKLERRLLHSVSDGLATAQRCLTNGSNCMAGILQKTFEKDEQRLMSIQQWIAMFNGNSDKQQNLSRIRILCARLTTCPTDFIRQRLHWMYLEALYTTEDIVQIPSATNGDLGSSLEKSSTALIPKPQMWTTYSWRSNITH